MRTRVIAIVSVALAIAGAPATAAETPPPVAKPVAALQQCRTVSDPAARLACYDKAVDGLTAATASNEIMIVERREVRQARRGLFGFALPKIGFLTGRSGNAEDRADEERLEAVIKSVRPTGFELWRFTLDDGAVWETTEASRMVDEPKPGATVVIERGTFGTFKARYGKGRSALVRRVK